MRGSPAREGWKFLYLVRFLFRMDVSVKPLYYDSVPPCLYTDCQLYDVQQMDRAKSSTVSSFLPHYTVSFVVPSSHIRSTPYAVSSALSSRPSCSVAASILRMVSVAAPFSCPVSSVAASTVSSASALSRPVLPGCPASSVAASPVQSSSLAAPFSCPVGPVHFSPFRCSLIIIITII